MDMFVKQLSVFIENREGRLEQVTEVLKEENINILSLSMADTTEYGMLRMIVSDPEKAKAGLRSKGFSAMLTDVLAVKLEDKVGEMHKMTHILCSQGLNLSLIHIYFAREETHLFKLLFINDMDLNMSDAKDFYKEAGNEKKAALFSKAIGVGPEQAKVIYLDLFLYTCLLYTSRCV